MLSPAELLCAAAFQSTVRHTPLSFWLGINAPVTETECEGPCYGMRRFPVTNREAHGMGPTGFQRGGEEGVRVYYRSVVAILVCRNWGWKAKKMTALAEDAFHSGNHYNQRKPAGCRHIANVLLEFMHKSNNTKRKETWGNSRRKQPHNAASVVSVVSKSGDASKPTNNVALHKHKTLRISCNPPRAHTHINP